jgi:predicted Zn finger-like uncharacterized protein
MARWEGGALANLEFRCLSCSTAFVVPADRIPPSGGKGKCTACGAGLVIFPDGRITPPLGAGIAAAQAPLPDDPIWEVRLANPNPDFSPGPHRLKDLRQMILDGHVRDCDLARALGGDWQPVLSYPALNNFFKEKAQMEREVHGDEDHCANHRDQTPGWRCNKCQNYLCKQCVVNRPVIAGGAANYLCAACEADTIALKGKGALKSLGGFFKK